MPKGTTCCHTTCVRHAWLLTLCGLAVCLQLFSAGPAPAQRAASYPSTGYFLGFPMLHAGEFDDAARVFGSAARGGLRTTEGRWIDSVCYYAMLGECQYHLGNLPQAMESYDAAIQVFLAHRNWLMRVQFPPGVRGVNARAVANVPWGPSVRNTSVGRFPNQMQMLMGRSDNANAIRQGGIIAPQQLLNVHVDEILRCTAVALRRRGQLLGPLAKMDPLNRAALDALAKRPAPPNHWSQAWISVLLGIAEATAGDAGKAKRQLELGLVVEGQYDHRLTSIALLELGTLAQREQQWQAAETFFREASLAAARFEQPDIMAEALREASASHMVTNAGTAYPPLQLAAGWAHRARYYHLEASMLVALADGLLTLRQTPAGQQALSEANRVVARRAMRNGSVGSRLEFQNAVQQFQVGNVTEGEKSLSQAVERASKSSVWLFQIQMADRAFVDSQLSPREADLVYARLLRDPSPADWSTDPVEVLVVLLASRQRSLENWYQVALERDEVDKALEIGDRMRRHRFARTLPLGGRLLSLRWLCSAPAQLLDETQLLQRRDLFTRYPQFAELDKQVAQDRSDLADALLIDDDAAQPGVGDLVQQIQRDALRQETILREIAVRREPCSLSFPPLKTVQSVRAELRPDQLVLAYVATSRRLDGFLLSRNQSARWSVASPRQCQRELSGILRDWGIVDPNAAVSAAPLTDNEWQTTSQELLQQLIADTQQGFWKRFGELIVVPDSWLWYLPFEALCVDSNGQSELLGSVMRVRYAPALSLAVPLAEQPFPRGTLAVIAGKLFPRDDAEISLAEAERLRAAREPVLTLSNSLPSPSSILRLGWKHLIVYDDVSDLKRGPYGWAPSQLDSGRPAADLASWMQYPWGGPQSIALPGYHTQAERALKSGGTGDDLFLPLCGLMSTGARTVLISRWRPGGQASFDLVREFSQELPHTSAAKAWQRGVQLIREQPLDLPSEPRVSLGSVTEPPSAQHPFFWAAYLLADTGYDPDPSPALPESEEASQPDKPAPAK